MNLEVEKIANAVLYEGYMLYPYRRSAIKNRQRWNFGVVYPQAHSELPKSVDSYIQQTECVICGKAASCVNIRVRFLQAVLRANAPTNSPLGEFGSDVSAAPGDRFGSPIETSWQETIEREILLTELPVGELLRGRLRKQFSFPLDACAAQAPQAEAVPIECLAKGRSIGGSVEIGAAECGEDVFRLTILLSNQTPARNLPLSREDLLLRSFLSAHTLLHVSEGHFISLTDPPPHLRSAAEGCHNIGTWPVLVGEESACDEMLSSPIILYDFPQIAPESPGDLFDSTEIDEILALRILTLSDDEKREIRQSDDRVREILDRTEMLPAEHFAKLHGVLRGMTPSIRTNEDAEPGGVR